MMAVPAEATPSGNRTPSCSTKERTGKLPSSRSRHTVSSPRRMEKKALSPVSSASRRRLGLAMSSSGKRAEATDPSSRISGPRTQLPLSGILVQQPLGRQGAQQPVDGGPGQAGFADQLHQGAALRLPADDAQQAGDPADHLGALDRD